LLRGTRPEYALRPEGAGRRRSCSDPDEDAYLSTGRAGVGMPDVGELGEDLGAPVQGLDDSERGARLIGCDVVVDAAKPSLRLGGPD